MKQTSMLKNQLIIKQYQIFSLKTDVNSIDIEISNLREVAKWSILESLAVIICFWLFLLFPIALIIMIPKEKARKQIMELEKKKQQLEQELHHLNNEYIQLLAQPN